MTTDAIPEHGDITISRTAGARYALAVTPGALQITCASYDEALATARRFAAERRVDVWAVIQGGDPVPVSRHRPGTDTTN